MTEDITSQLRRWTHSVTALPASKLMDMAADEIDRLRQIIKGGCTSDPSATDSLRGDYEVLRLRLQAAHAEIERLHTAIRRLADQDATFSVIGGNMIVDVDAKLTDAEREAICQAVGAYDANDDDEECAKIAATLRGLLERLK
jgi:hypothetical protein